MSSARISMEIYERYSVSVHWHLRISAQFENVFFGILWYHLLFLRIGKWFGQHNDDAAGELFHFGFFGVIDFMHEFSIRFM